ncbi:alpha-ketoacid dehydrogenase subunit beta [Rhodococcus sp. USK10]|uniref:3-methyl-2-oxobutanoate dehydrogenase subunit beta n=1 Tax=Rhodococcus wratislaviensis TaxID=44752 RepID=A0A402CMP3_RHOWR|nr:MULTISPECIES: alpha-ketoacid dehydrogenase subunit beta [Rhodococcus]QYB04676.1 alpha-ketoacid dehydrogenase subunit beta [Rhodococcus sp. USK10]GCE44982.1 Pyruvate dehydrogenase E1 component beta subunit [Rhodococcus wratislaviensis]
MTGMNMVEAVRSTLEAEMRRDERVVLLGEDVGKSGGVFRATDRLQTEFGADRVFDMPTSEAGIIGAAVGLAGSGLVPVVEMQFLGFTQQGFHQLGNQLARMRYRTNGALTMPVTIRAPFGGGVRTPELHSDAFEALFAHNPGMRLVAPATAADMKGLLATAIRDPDPIFVLEPLRGYRLVRDDVPDGDHLVPFGKARIAREGTDVTVIAWSAMVQVAMEAAAAAAEQGIDVQVIDLRSLVPLDCDAIREAVARTGRAIVVQEAPYTGGFAGEVAATIAEEAFLHLEAPVTRVGGYDIPFPMPQLEDHYIPDARRILRAIRAAVHF